MNLPLRQKKIMKKLFYTGPRNCPLTCAALFWPCMHRNALVRNFFRKLQSGAKWWRKEKTKVPNWEVMWRQVTVWRRKKVNMYRHHSHTPIICEIIFYAKYFSIFSSYHLPVFLHSLHRMHPALLFGHYTNCAVGQKLKKSRRYSRHQTIQWKVIWSRWTLSFHNTCTTNSKSIHQHLNR